MIPKDKIYAIIGASNNQEKYGHQVLNDLLSAGYKAIPINNKEEFILGERVYHSLSKFTDTIDIAVFVVPPQVTESILREVKELGIKTVWLQPGSESDAAIRFCEENGIECVHDACIMIERKKE